MSCLNLMLNPFYFCPPRNSQWMTFHFSLTIILTMIYSPTKPPEAKKRPRNGDIIKGNNQTNNQTNKKTNKHIILNDEGRNPGYSRDVSIGIHLC